MAHRARVAMLPPFSISASLQSKTSSPSLYTFFILLAALLRERNSFFIYIRAKFFTADN